MSGLTDRAAQVLADLRRRSDALKRRSEELERRNAKLADDTDQVRQDWRRKRADPSVPGALPEERDGPGGDGDGS